MQKKGPEHGPEVKGRVGGIHPALRLSWIKSVLGFGEGGVLDKTRSRGLNQEPNRLVSRSSNLPPMPPPPPSPWPSGEPEPPSPAGPWLEELKSLLRGREFSEGAFSGLPDKALGTQAGSWLDPLFEGPAPISEFQGLGERYTQLQFLGEGASGIVFKALDNILQRWVALKVLKGASPSALAEARAQAQVEHLHVCRVYEVDRGFIVMQLVEGPSLASLAPTLSLRAKVVCLRGIAEGVHAAHIRGLLHLDLKPGNILLQPRPDGTFTPVVTDFGMVLDLANTHGKTCPLGTPPYTSPEQLAGDPKGVSPASDVYALGMLGYVLLGGQAPFPSAGLDRLLADMARTPPLPLSQVAPWLPKDLAKVIHRCLDKDPTKRYAYAGDLAEECDRFLQHRPLIVMGRALPYRALRFVQRNRVATWILGMGLLILSASIGVGLWRETRIAQRAEWDRHFQKRVEEARVDLERAYRRPPHDIRGDMDKVQGTMDEIRDEMNRLGRPAQGPGHLALGQLLLTKDTQSEEAARHFQMAWDSGLRTEGARTWLAYALLQRYQDAIRSAQLQGGAISPGPDREALRARYMEPARRMLQGRRDTDQARLAHMMDLVEAQLGGADDRADRLAKAVKLAVAYRQQAPHDLEALLEEIEARYNQIKAWVSVEAESPAPANISVAWQALAQCLGEGASAAPSHPRFCLMLAKGCLFRIDYPALVNHPRKSALDECRRWIAQGLKVSPDDPDLNGASVDLLSREGLQGSKPMEVVHREMLRSFLESGRSRESISNALLQHIFRGQVYDRDLVPFGLEVLFSIRERSDARKVRSLFGATLMGLAVRQGRNPEPIGEAMGPDVEPWCISNAAFNRLDWQIISGRAGEVTRPQLQSLTQASNSGPAPQMVKLQLLDLSCKVQRSREDWVRLHQAFEALDWPRVTNKELIFRHWVWVNAGITLVEQAHELGADPRPVVDQMMKRLGNLRTSGTAMSLHVSYLRSRVILCAARVSLGSTHELEEAIHYVDKFLNISGRATPFPDIIPLELILPGRGTLLQFRGELRLQAAKGLKGNARVRAARGAENDLVEALTRCPGLRSVLLSLQRDARRLQGFGPVS